MGLGFEYESAALNLAAAALQTQGQALGGKAGSLISRMSVKSGAFGKLPESHQAESDYHQQALQGAIDLLQGSASVPAGGLPGVLTAGGKNLAQTATNYDNAENAAARLAGGGSSEH